MNTSIIVFNDQDTWHSNQSVRVLLEESFTSFAHGSLSSQFDNTTTWSIDRMAWAGGVLVWSGDAEYQLGAADLEPAEQWIRPIGLLYLQPVSLCLAKPDSTVWGR